MIITFLRTYGVVIIVSAIIIVYGALIIGTFETSDEHFWRDLRIPQYWHALATNDFAQTAINDKPGVSVALVSGIGLLFADNGDTMVRNIALRVPLLLIHAFVFLPLLFWLLRKAFSPWIANAGIILIGLTPALFGMSIIVNPDALLWSSATVALLAFLALLQAPQSWRYSIILGCTFGFALLSKYTANLLFLFFAMLLFFQALFILSPRAITPFLRALLTRIAVAFGIALMLFVAFLPAVIVQWHLLVESTVLSPPMKPLALPLLVFAVVLIADTYLFRNTLLRSCNHLAQKLQPLLRLAPVPLLALIVFVFINARLTTPIIPLDNVKEVVDTKKGLDFVWFEGNPALVYFIKEVIVEAYNALFALPTPTAVLLIITLMLLVLWRQWPQKYVPFLLFAVIAPFVFFVGGLVADVFVTVRYSILLQPIFALLVLIVCERVLILWRASRSGMAVITVGLLALMAVLLWRALPYPLVYQNAFLPQERLVTDAWGYGSYEAAQWLNALPDAENLTVWSDRKGVCYHFVGHCTLRNKIQPDELPDYFVFSRRNIARKKHFGWVAPAQMRYTPEAYYAKPVLSAPIWRHIIHNRPQNYTLIIKRADAEAIIQKTQSL